MYSLVIAPRPALPFFLVLTIFVSSFPLTDVSKARLNSQRQNAARPRRGKPEGTLPDLDEVKNESQTKREMPASIPSTMRSPKVPLEPWNDPRDIWSQIKTAQPGEQIRRAHARRRMNAPPPLPDDQFVQNFFSWALLRVPNDNEPTYWNDQFRIGYGQGQESLRLAAIELGKTLFESAEYAGRNRDNHWYVYDLYKTYLMRDPESGGWANWEAAVPVYGREYVRRGFEDSTEFANLIAGLTPNGSASSAAASLISARVDPRNQPDKGMLTRDA